MRQPIRPAGPSWSVPTHATCELERFNGGSGGVTHTWRESGRFAAEQTAGTMAT
jgi:hypothetical protein